jgi:hypothetical protein
MSTRAWFKFPAAVGKSSQDWETRLVGKVRQREGRSDSTCRDTTFTTPVRKAAKKG